jgi:hypothetical protein
MPAVASKFHVCHRKQGSQIHGKWVADALAIIGTTCPRQVFRFKRCKCRGRFVKPCKPIPPHKMQIKTKRPLRVGLFGIGLDAYWPQFKGLKPRLEGYVRVVRDRLRRPGVEVVNLGLIDSPFKALEAGHRFRQEDVDLIFLHVTTYALSSTVLLVVQRAKVPVIVLNLQPAPAIDYATFNKMGDRTTMTSGWRVHCAACPVPEIANVFTRAGISFRTGTLHDDPVFWNEMDNRRHYFENQ